MIKSAICIVLHLLHGIEILFPFQVHLLRSYKIRNSPTFVIVDAKTKRTIAVDGRRALNADPTGRRFPW